MSRYDELRELKVIESSVGLKNFTIPLRLFFLSFFLLHFFYPSLV